MNNFQKNIYKTAEEDIIIPPPELNHNVYFTWNSDTNLPQFHAELNGTDLVSDSAMVSPYPAVAHSFPVGTSFALDASYYSPYPTWRVTVAVSAKKNGVLQYSTPAPAFGVGSFGDMTPVYTIENTTDVWEFDCYAYSENFS
jgi:hypothetical protein